MRATPGGGDEREGLSLEEARDVQVTLPHLQAEGDFYEFEKEASGRWMDGKWVIDVKMAHDLTTGRGPIAVLRLVYGAGNRPAEDEPVSRAERCLDLDSSVAANLRWSNACSTPSLPRARWTGRWT